MTSLLKNAIGSPGIETAQPQGLQLFDELVKTCNELAKVNKPLIIY